MLGDNLWCIDPLFGSEQGCIASSGHSGGSEEEEEEGRVIGTGRDEEGEFFSPEMFKERDLGEIVGFLFFFSF